MQTKTIELKFVPNYFKSYCGYPLHGIIRSVCPFNHINGRTVILTDDYALAGNTIVSSAVSLERQRLSRSIRAGAAVSSVQHG